MSYNEASQFSGYFGRSTRVLDQQGRVPTAISNREEKKQEPDTSFLHGMALARDFWAEHYGHWIIFLYIAFFALVLIGMDVFGQIPGKSFVLKGTSDILQFVGEGIGFVFCARVALRLRRISNGLGYELLQQRRERRSPGELAQAHNEAEAAHRAFIAWSLLALGIALYATGQAVWTSYDIRMNSADVPFPGIYDIGFVGSYPFFLIGTLLLTRKNKASVGRARLLLDALAVIGTSLALSWFFLLNPVIAGLSQEPSTGAAVLSIYFPTGDLFLVAVGAFMMFSPLANRSQQTVFMLLCMGLFFLAITDSLLSYYSLSFNFNTGTLQDVLWPLSMSLIGLAAVEYPRSIAREQEQSERMKNAVGLQRNGSNGPTRFNQFSMTAQTIAPFILVLITCAILLTNIAPRGGAILVEADIVSLALILVIIVRQALTLIENNQLTMQMRGELVISRRELQVTRREADEATKTVQEKQELDEGIAILREIHARVARGDIIARAPSLSGPLLPIAISLNLMLDRISALSQRGARYDQLAQECRILQEGIERVGQGLNPWPSNQPAPQGAVEMRAVFMSLTHIQRIQESQWKRIVSALESMRNLTKRIHRSMNEIRQMPLWQEQMGMERMVLERIAREIDLLEQQQSGALEQISTRNGENERNTPIDNFTHNPNDTIREQNLLPETSLAGQTIPMNESQPSYVRTVSSHGSDWNAYQQKQPQFQPHWPSLEK